MDEEAKVHKEPISPRHQAVSEHVSGFAVFLDL